MARIGAVVVFAVVLPLAASAPAAAQFPGGVDVSCSPDFLAVGQQTTCTATGPTDNPNVEDFSVGFPAGFSPGDCPSLRQGCSAVYTPSKSGLQVITASFHQSEALAPLLVAFTLLQVGAAPIVTGNAPCTRDSCGVCLTVPSSGRTPGP